MKLRISKNKKIYTIEIIDKKKVIEKYQINKIESFQLLDVYQKKIKSIELSNNLILTYRSSYPKFNKKKIIKKHLGKFLNINNQNTIKVIKKIVFEEDNNMICCFYYIGSDIITFVKNNNLINIKYQFIQNNLIFNKNHKFLILMNKYEVSFYQNYVLKYHSEYNNKNINSIMMYLQTFLFVNLNIKMVTAYIDNDCYNEYIKYFVDLKDILEERTKLIVEKI